jgi:hypothetical protein
MNKELIEYALKEFTPCLDKILACLDPRRIWSHEYSPGETFYSLDTRQLQSRHILQSWIYQGKRLEECSPQEYLVGRARERSDRVEFSILEQQDVALIVWESAVEGMPRVGNGGTRVLRKANNHWEEVRDARQAWWS